MNLVQACAFSNWDDESFEVWKWFDASEKSETITRQMESLFLNLFEKVMTSKTDDDLKKANRTIGLASVTIEVTKKHAEMLLPFARFFHYYGRCLDPQDKSYFAAHEIETSGLARIHNDSIKIMKTRENMQPVTDAELDIIRNMFERESDEIKNAIESLGTELDNLFQWKEKFKTKNSSLNEI